MHIKPTRALLFICAALTTACATAPPAIRNAPPGPALGMVQKDPAQHAGQSVRWGGVIVRVDNQADHTAIQVVARPLHRSGRPVDTSNSPGRFIAKAAGFVEPNEYKKGREITVVGSVSGTRVQNIGQHPYTFPLIAVREMYLWEEEPEYRPYPYPYAGYPYYWDPFYPWGYGYGYFRYNSHRHYYPRHDRPHYRGKPHPDGGHKHGGKYKK